MQKTPPMHLNTSPTCFEGSGTGKRVKRHKTLKNLKLAPKKQLGIYMVGSIFLIPQPFINFWSGAEGKALPERDRYI